MIPLTKLPQKRIISWLYLRFFLTLRQQINVKYMENAIIGRKAEIERLNKYIASDRSEFIAIYGRRRVGKTFLIKAPLPKTIGSNR